MFNPVLVDDVATTAFSYSTTYSAWILIKLSYVSTILDSALEGELNYMKIFEDFSAGTTQRTSP